MGIPVVTGDVGGPYTLPPDVIPIATMVVGSPTVTVKGKSPMLFGLALTNRGPIVSSTLNTVKVTINGLPVLLGGTVTSLASGHSGGVVASVGAIGVTMT